MVTGGTPDEFVDSVRRKLRMAQYARDLLVELKLDEGDGTEIETRTAALLEACLHYLHHCRDILAQAIAAHYREAITQGGVCLPWSLPDEVPTMLVYKTPVTLEPYRRSGERQSASCGRWGLVLGTSWPS